MSIFSSVFRTTDEKGKKEGTRREEIGDFSVVNHSLTSEQPSLCLQKKKTKLLFVINTCKHTGAHTQLNITRADLDFSCVMDVKRSVNPFNSASGVSLISS